MVICVTVHQKTCCLLTWYDVYYFFCSDTATTEICTDCHTLSLHDALPIFARSLRIDHDSAFPAVAPGGALIGTAGEVWAMTARDRKSTRLNSSHQCASRTPCPACKNRNDAH